MTKFKVNLINENVYLFRATQRFIIDPSFFPEEIFDTRFETQFKYCKMCSPIGMFAHTHTKRSQLYVIGKISHTLWFSLAIKHLKTILGQ